MESGRWQAAGGRQQAAGGRWQVAGSRRQVAGGRQQAAGGRWQVAGSRQQAAGGRWQAAGSRWQVAGSRQQAAGSRQQAAGGRQQAAGGRQAAGERCLRGPLDFGGASNVHRTSPGVGTREPDGVGDDAARHDLVELDQARVDRQARCVRAGPPERPELVVAQVELASLIGLPQAVGAGRGNGIVRLIQHAGRVVKHEDVTVRGAGGERAAWIGALDGGVGREWIVACTQGRSSGGSSNGKCISLLYLPA